ncbi:MAG TPA: cellulose biosynthesis cyclic di-GMP-binding regulatory protein BcsB [Actinomycetota bacterium]|nr:cellulose biosynthesis cyclic di-GMP-binding regulatory protein BcsB [Actinomycetota bacterium]
MRRISIVFALAALLLSAAPIAAAEGAPLQEPVLERFALPLEDAGAVASVLRPSRTFTRFQVAVPHRWTHARFDTTVRWTASNLVGEGSALTVEVDDVPVTAVPVAAGPGSVTIASPLLPLDEHTITVTIRATLQAVPGVSARSAARGLFLRLDPFGRVQVSGTGVAQPLLSDLPGALVERVGDRVTPLTIVFPPHPPAQAIHAAAIVAGAVSTATGFPGVRIATLIDPGEAEIAARPGALVRFVDQPGDPVLSIARRSGGESALTVAGRGDALVRAAWTAAYHAARLTGPTAVVRAATVPVPALAPEPRRIELGPAGVEDSEPVTLRLPFRLPVNRVIEAAEVVLEVSYDAPAGARISVRANGKVMEARALRANESRTRVAVSLTDAVRPGDNSIEIVLTPSARPDAALPARLDVLTGSTLALRTRERAEPSLGWWPFLGSGDRDWSRTVVSLPASPTAQEVDAVVAVLSEAVRWSGGPLRYSIAFDASIQETLRTRNLVSLVRDPVHVSRFVPGGATHGTLAVTRRGERAALVAVGARALAPLASSYFAGVVHGRAVVVDARGDARPIVPALGEPDSGRSWWLPAGVAAGLTFLVLLIGFIRAKRRFSPGQNDVPWNSSVPEAVVPRTKSGVIPPVEPPVDTERALEDWLRIREEHRL